MKNKKALSEVIAYVLLIVIALSIAGTVYSWMRFYVPSGESETCSEDISLYIKDYSCANNMIQLKLENKGYFPIKGFYIKSSNSSDEKKLPTTSLTSIEQLQNQIKGRYEFVDPFNPGDTKILNFSYEGTGEIKKLRLQPYITSETTKKVILCGNRMTSLNDILDCGVARENIIVTEENRCDTPPIAGYSAWWKFEGNANDCTGRNNGVAVGTEAISYEVLGKVGQALRLSGISGSYIKIDNSVDIQFNTDNFTISFWVSPTDKANMYLLNKYPSSGNGRWYLWINANKNISFNKNTPPALTSTTINPNTWNHIIFSRETSKGKICINNICKESSTYFNNINLDNPQELRIGCSESGTNCLTGMIDEIMIFNRTLTSTEIETIYNSQSN